MAKIDPYKAGFDPSHGALRARAAQRLRVAGIGVCPPITAPRIQFGHVDGPVLHRLDATMHWLSWVDRFRIWFGLADAWSLEADQQRREWQAATPCAQP